MLRFLNLSHEPVIVSDSRLIAEIWQYEPLRSNFLPARLSGSGQREPFSVALELSAFSAYMTVAGQALPGSSPGQRSATSRRCQYFTEITIGPPSAATINRLSVFQIVSPRGP